MQPLTDDFHNSGSLRNMFLRIGFSVVSGGLLSIAFIDHRFYALAWVALVPVLWAIENASLRQVYSLGLATGLVFFISGCYWITDFIILSKGYSTLGSYTVAGVYWLYSAQFFALSFMLYHWLRRSTGLHEAFLFPLTIAGFSVAFPMVFTLHLGDTQVFFPLALQALDLVGVLGLDVIIALSNLVVARLIYRFVRRDQLQQRLIDYGVAAALLVISIWFAYGAIQYPRWLTQVADWKTLKVGFVQPNEMPSLDAKKARPGFSQSYPPAMAMTERLAALDVALVIWPEAKYQGYLDTPQIRRAFQHRIAEMETWLLIQDFETQRSSQTGEVSDLYNSAVLIDDHGQTAAKYRKIQRIPFGEYVPVVSEHSFLKNLLQEVLGDFLNEISKGESAVVFQHPDATIVPLICYETTFADFVAQAITTALDDGFETQPRVLVGMSNDGWFGATVQPFQHGLPSVLRSVEHRSPMIHVINNGPSVVTGATGDFIKITDAFQAGGYVVDVPLNQGTHVSFFSRHPFILRNSLWILMLLVITIGVVRTIKRMALPATNR